MKKKDLKNKSDLELIWLQQDINRFGNEGKYTKEFEKLVRDEICNRGKKLMQKKK